MRRPHPQTHVTLWYCGQVTNKKSYLSTFAKPVGLKLSKVLTQDERTPPTKSRDTSCHVMWQIKNVISSLSQGLWTPNLTGRWLRMRGLHPQSHVILQYCGHVTNKRRYLSVDLKLSRVPTQDNWSPKNHVTLQFCSHIRIWKYHIFSTTRPIAPKLSRMCTYVEGLSLTKPNNTFVSWTLYNGFTLTFIFTFTWLMVCSIG